MTDLVAVSEATSSIPRSATFWRKEVNLSRESEALFSVHVEISLRHWQV